MKVVNLIDFRGGYFTNTPSELMKDNELLKAENCHWDNGLVKRLGKDTYNTTSWAGFDGAKGAIRVYMNGAWRTIVALDDGSDVNFYQGTGTTFAAIDNTYDFNTGYDVEFAELDGHVVAVNGVDKPAVIYYDSGYVVEDLETYDTRDWEKVNCSAGLWDDSETVPFIDDKQNSFEDKTSDFQIGNTTNYDGIYISCDFRFTKVVFHTAEQATGSPVAEYTYWNGTAWTTLTPTTTPNWTAAAGDRTLEFDVPQDGNGENIWLQYYEEDGSSVVDVPGRFIIRIRFTTAASAAFNCLYLSLHHTQYLTEILEDERPHTVTTHNGVVFLATNILVNYSEFLSLKNWQEYKVQWFEAGGTKIKQMISFKDTLVVFKQNTLYTFDTTSLSDPIRSRPLTAVGAISNRSAAEASGLLFFMAADGVYIWDGSRATKVSRHIQDDIDSYTLTNCAGIGYRDEYWVSFPTDEITLRLDPDTFRTDGEGNGVVSFFKFTNYASHKFLYQSMDDDNELFLALVDTDPPALDRCENGTADGSTPIVMTAKTRFVDFTGFQKHKFMGRFKPKIKEVSAAAGQTHTLNFYSEDGRKTAQKITTVTVGSGYYSTDVSLPYSMDGKNIAFEFYHAGTTSAGLIGYAVELDNRRF